MINHYGERKSSKNPVLMLCVYFSLTGHINIKEKAEMTLTTKDMSQYFVAAADMNNI